ncbi:DUF4148 domain-containing protein [Noviherbaspirillum sp.]|uniref:DUF4148 domain-containing protein n=1 Tax=Noviherbaspirillum sp. TaxID=1926288 RepID=UPI002FE09B0E
MNAKKLIAAVAALAVAGSAFAIGSDDTAHYSLGKSSSKTRAEVMAELRQVQADGTYIVGGQEFDGQIPATQTQYARTAPKGTETAQSDKASNAVKTN